MLFLRHSINLVASSHKLLLFKRKSSRWFIALTRGPRGTDLSIHKQPEGRHLLACVAFLGNDSGFLKRRDEGWQVSQGMGDNVAKWLLYRLLLQSRHRILSGPSGKKPAPTSEAEHWEQVKHGWCHWRSSNEMYFPPPKPGARRAARSNWMSSFRRWIQKIKTN